MQLTLDGDNELGNNWENLGTTLLEHIEGSLHGEESVWVLLLTDALEEDGQVVMVVERHDVNLPEELVGGTVVDGDGKISSVVETSEFRGWDGSSPGGAGFGLGDGSLLLWLGQRGVLASKTSSLLESNT